MASIDADSYVTLDLIRGHNENKKAAGSGDRQDIHCAKNCPRCGAGLALLLIVEAHASSFLVLISRDQQRLNQPAPLLLRDAQIALSRIASWSKHTETTRGH